MTRVEVLQRLQNIRSKAKRALDLLQAQPVPTAAQAEIQSLVQWLKDELHSECTRISTERVQRTMTMKPLNRAAPFRVCLSICVQRAALKARPPFGRTLSFPKSATRLWQGADSLPQASWGPFPQIPASRLGSGSRRHTLRANMYRRQRTNQKKRSQTPCSTRSSHRPTRTERRRQNRSEYPR